MARRQIREDSFVYNEIYFIYCFLQDCISSVRLLLIILLKWNYHNALTWQFTNSVCVCELTPHTHTQSGFSIVDELLIVLTATAKTGFLIIKKNKYTSHKKPLNHRSPF